MKLGGGRLVRRSIFLTAACMLALVLTACTGKGGGYLPPGPSAGTDVFPQAQFPGTVFTGQAPFGFTFSCEDKGGLNPPTGKLAIERAYSDQGTSPFLAAPFSIHGIVDKIDPVLESQICQGQEPPPGGNELIFLGRYRPTSSSKPGGLKSCPTSETTTSSLCRFEVIVQDNDDNLRPSKGDFFSIKLSSATAVTSTLDPLKVFYARAGTLAGGNLTVK
jgi:predicted small lipoprotein YifL